MIMLSEGSQTEKTTYCMIPCISKFRIYKLIGYIESRIYTTLEYTI